jgi:hypothetical protein
MAIFVGGNVLIETCIGKERFITTEYSKKLRGAEVEIINSDNKTIVLSGHQYSILGNVWEVAEVLGIKEN